jgi:hypothetical protein
VYSLQQEEAQARLKELLPMRNLLAFLAVLVLGFAALGFCCGWYEVESLPSAEGRSAYRIDIDRTKVTNDVKGAARWIARKLREKEEKKTAESEAK